MQGGDIEFEVFDPPLFVIAGSWARLDSPTKRRSFELFRNGLSNVQLVTFDELFDKMRAMVAQLESVSMNAKMEDAEATSNEFASKVQTEADSLFRVEQECPLDSAGAATELSQQCAAEILCFEFGTESSDIDSAGGHVEAVGSPALAAYGSPLTEAAPVEELAGYRGAGDEEGAAHSHQSAVHFAE